MNDSIDINVSLKIIKDISPYLLKMREKASNEYKESNNDFVHKADMLCLSFMQKIESSKNLYYSVLSSKNLMGKIVDINSLYTLYRSLLETLIYFHYGFVLPNNTDEKTLSILLWKIAGLQNYINTQENIPNKIKIKTNHYVEDYNNIKREIIKIISKYKFNEESNKLIKSFMKESYKFTNAPYTIKLLDGELNSIHKLTITEATNTYFSDKKVEIHDLYTILSVSAHPSYLGLQRYEEALRSAMNSDLKKMNNHLSIIFRGIVILSSCFQDEYEEFLKKYRD
nr:hypothetical protein [Prevotella sp.]